MSGYTNTRAGGITLETNRRDRGVLVDHIDSDGDRVRIRAIDDGEFLFSVAPGRFGSVHVGSVPAEKLRPLRDALTAEIERAEYDARRAAHLERMSGPRAYVGSDGDGAPHCSECYRHGHTVAHPDLGCADVGCDAEHAPDDPEGAETEVVTGRDAPEGRGPGTPAGGAG